MGIKLSSKPTVTDVGTSKLLLVSDTQLNLIDADDLPNSGGGGGFNFLSGKYYPLQGNRISSTGNDGRVSTSGLARGFFMMAGDYSGISLCLNAQSYRGSSRVGIYAYDGNTQTIGNLVKDIGEVVVNAAGVFTYPNQIGVIDYDAIIIDYYNVTSGGNISRYTLPVGSSSEFPVYLNATGNANVPVSFEATFTYPTPDTPITPPAMTPSLSASVCSLFLYKP